MNRYNPKQIKWTYMSGLHAESLEKKKKEKKKGGVGWGGGGHKFNRKNVGYARL